MEKKTAEEILRDNAAVPKPQIPGVLNAMEEYSSLQSEEKDKEIDNLQRIIKEEREIRQRHEVTLSKMLAKQRDEIERLREALSDLFDHAPNEEFLNPNSSDFDKSFNAAIVKAKAALSNQPIESDKIMKEEKHNGYAPINITQAEEIEAKDRRIKELEEALSRVSNCNDLTTAREYAKEMI